MFRHPDAGAVTGTILGADALPTAEAFLVDPDMLADEKGPMPTNQLAANREVAFRGEGGEVGAQG